MAIFFGKIYEMILSLVLVQFFLFCFFGLRLESFAGCVKKSQNTSRNVKIRHSSEKVKNYRYKTIFVFVFRRTTTLILHFLFKPFWVAFLVWGFNCLQVAARNVSGCVGMCRDVSQCVEAGRVNLLVTQRVNFKNFVEEENRLLVEARKGAARHQTSLCVKGRIFALL